MHIKQLFTNGQAIVFNVCNSAIQMLAADAYSAFEEADMNNLESVALVGRR